MPFGAHEQLGERRIAVDNRLCAVAATFTSTTRGDPEKDPLAGRPGALGADSGGQPTSPME